MFCGCYGTFWDVLDVLGGFGKFWDVLECFGTNFTFMDNLGRCGGCFGTFLDI